MADSIFDVVIIGGGAKSLVTAIYLAKYGGMTVGVFERRHELGGGLTSTEASAPGFVGDVHASQMMDFYYLPVQQDFPDFEEKGGKLLMCKGSAGIITRENQECLINYSIDYDPTQEKTAHEITRFAGEKDAETFGKLWEYDQKSDQTYYDAFVETLFNLPVLGEEAPLRKWINNYLKQPDCLIDADWLFLSAYRAVRQLFENSALNYLFLRKRESAGQPILEPGGASGLIGQALIGSRPCFVQGGTHNIAHAYIKILLSNGGKFFTKCHVDKIIIENGIAKGIRLSDGTQIEARKFVLSGGLNLRQLCFELLGSEHFSQRLLRKVEGIEATQGTITWYTWSLREPAVFKASDYNPEINETQGVVLGCQDLEVLRRSVHMRNLGMIPPIESSILHQMFIGDKHRYPENRQTVMSEQFVIPANLFSEREWLQFKIKHAEDVVSEWQVYTTNLNWDNIIGYDPVTPYDTVGRLINMSPTGDWFTINVEPARPIGTLLPSEFAQYRIPNIKNLYATGAQWGPYGGSCMEGYRAYKIIAEDLGLPKPWEEKGRPY